MSAAIRAAEAGLVPDPLVRWGIRRLLQKRLRSLEEEGPAEEAKRRFVRHMSGSPVALVPEKANDQHYELPPAFFEAVLGPHLKYSSGLFEGEGSTLAEAEAAMLRATCERAGVADGMRILDLGCGWGSLSLWIAERYPRCEVTGVSNSAPQRAFIEARARARGLTNVRIVTADMNRFSTDESFDRVISIEMFEHMRNWSLLLQRVKGWLAPGGRVFLHVFAHRERAYAYEVRDASDWMSEHFFTGGMMPSDDLAARVPSGFDVERRWVVNGTHYARTAEAWLRNLDARRAEVMPVLAATYGEANAPRWFRRWRMFFLACAELFGYRSGEEWWVAHALLRPEEEP